MPYEPISNVVSPDPEKPAIEKNFDTWNSLKKNIQSSDHEIVCNEREIWWCSLGLNIGHEQDGKNQMFERPVLIIRRFNKFICLCVPLTSSSKNNTFHESIPSFGPSDFVITSQIRLVSTKRFIRKFEKSVSRKDFRKIKEALHRAIG
jgi:mRNA-degrading endonuclease toxin of MazEF toxin-antitoxin module